MSFVMNVVIVPMIWGGGELWHFTAGEFRALVAVQMPAQLLLIAPLPRHYHRLLPAHSCCVPRPTWLSWARIHSPKPPLKYP